MNRENMTDKQDLIQFDVEPQQMLLGNFQTGIQIVATINIEDLIDKISLDGEEDTATLLGTKLIELLKVNGSIVDVIDPEKHINDVLKEVIDQP